MNMMEYIICMIYPFRNLNLIYSWKADL